MPKLSVRVVVASAVLALAAVSCSSDSGDDAGTATTAANTAAATTTVAHDCDDSGSHDEAGHRRRRRPPGTRYYVSLGDSYAVGLPARTGASTTAGFAYQLVDEALSRLSSNPLELANFACSRRHDDLLSTSVGCPERRPSAPAPPPTTAQTQIEAAEDLPSGPSRPGRPHHRVDRRERVSEVAGCQPDPVPCVTGAVSEVSTNVTTIVQRCGRRPAPTGDRRHDLPRRPAGRPGSPATRPTSSWPPCWSPCSRASSTRRSRRPTKSRRGPGSST